MSLKGASWPAPESPSPRGGVVLSPQARDIFCFAAVTTRDKDRPVVNRDAGLFQLRRLERIEHLQRVLRFALQVERIRIRGSERLIALGIGNKPREPFHALCWSGH